MAKKKTVNVWDSIDKEIKALEQKREALMKAEGQKAREGSIVDLKNEHIARYNLADDDEDLTSGGWNDEEVEGEFQSYNLFTGMGESGDSFNMTRQEVVDQANETYNDRINDHDFEILMEDIKEDIFSETDLRKLHQEDCWLWKIDEKKILEVPDYYKGEKERAVQRKANEEALADTKKAIAEVRIAIADKLYAVHN
jgi:hypothetical protein